MCAGSNCHQPAGLGRSDGEYVLPLRSGAHISSVWAHGDAEMGSWETGRDHRWALCRAQNATGCVSVTIPGPGRQRSPVCPTTFAEHSMAPRLLGDVCRSSWEAPVMEDAERCGAAGSPLTSIDGREGTRDTIKTTIDRRKHRTGGYA